MELTSALSGIQTAKIGSEIQIAVAKKMLDAQKMNGAAAIRMLEAAANVPAQAGDALAAAATGLGATIDTYG
jgi:hypothetical protein